MSDSGDSGGNIQSNASSPAFNLNDETKSDEITISDNEENQNLLNIRDQKKVIHEYRLKKPQPTINFLAAKYKVSAKHISSILKNATSILQSDKSGDEDECSREASQREEQIEFLDMVMFEYLQRMLYHNIPVSEKLFEIKAADVSECMAIAKFRVSKTWNKNFKKKFDIEHFGRESLLEKVSVNEAKSRSLSPVAMVRYVQKHKDVCKKAQKRSDNKKELECEKADDEPNLSHNMTDDIADIKIEISPTQLTEGHKGLHTKQQHVKGKARPKGEGKKRPLLAEDNSNKHEPGSHSVDDGEEYVTIYQIVGDDEKQSPEKDKRKCSNTNLSSTLGSSKQTEKQKESIPLNIKPEHDGGVTIKTEPESHDTEFLDCTGIDMPTKQTSHRIGVVKKEGNQQFHTVAHNASQHFHHLTKSHGVVDRLGNGEDEEIMTYENSKDRRHASSKANRKRHLSLSPLPDIETVEEAIRHLKVVENYVMLQENFRAIGLVTQLQDAIRKPAPKE